MKYLMIFLFKYCLRFLYFFMKLFVKTEKKIVYLSRQSNEKSLDMKMLENEIKQHFQYKQVFRLRTLDAGLMSGIKYIVGLVGDMYHMAGSQIAICDTYSLVVSFLHHKKDLTVIQMWHAMGAIKKFGFQSIGLGEGRDERLSRAMHMHENYDYVIAPSKETAYFYKEAFGVKDEQINICSLPHIDYIKDGKTRKNDFLELYPQAINKKIVVYVPTFREKEEDIITELKECFENEENIELFISLHPYSKVKEKEKFCIKGDFSTFELIKMADYVITDYSACAFEAAILDCPLFFYVPDYEYYENNRGLNIDLYKEMPQYTFGNAKEILGKINAEIYDKEDLRAFRKKYVEKTEKCTKELSTFIEAIVKRKEYEKN